MRKQISPSLWKRHAEYPEIPFAAVTASAHEKNNGTTRYSLTVLCCPYCGERHHHGGATPEKSKLLPGHDFGHRVEHCSDRFIGRRYYKRQPRNGYFLVFIGEMK